MGWYGFLTKTRVYFLSYFREIHALTSVLGLLQSCLGITLVTELSPVGLVITVSGQKKSDNKKRLCCFSTVGLKICTVDWVFFLIVCFLCSNQRLWLLWWTNSCMEMKLFGEDLFYFSCDSWLATLWFLTLSCLGLTKRRRRRSKPKQKHSACSPVLLSEHIMPSFSTLRRFSLFTQRFRTLNSSTSQSSFSSSSSSSSSPAPRRSPSWASGSAIVAVAGVTSALALFYCYNSPTSPFHSVFFDNTLPASSPPVSEKSPLPATAPGLLVGSTFSVFQMIYPLPQMFSFNYT